MSSELENLSFLSISLDTPTVTVETIIISCLDLKDKIYKERIYKNSLHLIFLFCIFFPETHSPSFSIKAIFLKCNLIVLSFSFKNSSVAPDYLQDKLISYMASEDFHYLFPSHCSIFSVNSTSQSLESIDRCMSEPCFLLSPGLFYLGGMLNWTKMFCPS